MFILECDHKHLPDDFTRYIIDQTTRTSTELWPLTLSMSQLHVWYITIDTWLLAEDARYVNVTCFVAQQVQDDSS